jgi:hypothetical protein
VDAVVHFRCQPCVSSIVAEAAAAAAVELVALVEWVAVELVSPVELVADELVAFAVLAIAELVYAGLVLAVVSAVPAAVSALLVSV